MRERRSWPGTWVAIAVGATFAIALAVGLGRGSDPTGVSEPLAELDARAELEALRAALENEAFEREMLAAEVELMRTVIERLAADRYESASGASEEAGAQTAAKPGDDQDLDEQLLAELRLAESEVRELRDRWDEAVLTRLELTDRATREGWLARPRHRRHLALLELSLLEELGELDYERMLYATGQPNRAVVQSIIGGSAAAIAGLEPGDHVLSYGGQRAFRPKDLRAMTTSGVKGEQVRMIIERRGQRLSFVVPRGPLGVRLTAGKSPPTR